MLVVALTGGIGSGKSTACRYFEQLGVPVIDADLIARKLVQPGEAALDEIAQQLGSSLLTSEGELDRAQLRQIVFSDPDKKKLLESILHPRVRSEMKRRIETLTAPYCIVAIPLLVETGQLEIADRILVIDSDEAEQIKRATKRDNQPEEAVRLIISAQADRPERLAVADDIILNDGDLQNLRQQVQKLHDQYLLITT